MTPWPGVWYRPTCYAFNQGNRKLGTRRNRRRVPNGAGMDLALNGDTRVDSREPRRRGYLSETEGNES